MVTATLDHEGHYIKVLGLGTWDYGALDETIDDNGDIIDNDNPTTKLRFVYNGWEFATAEFYEFELQYVKFCHKFDARKFVRKYNELLRALGLDCTFVGSQRYSALTVSVGAGVTVQHAATYTIVRRSI